MHMSCRLKLSALAASIVAVGVAAPALGAPAARTPIEHVIVIVGENHTFDNLFGAYQPVHGQRVANLLSRGIVNADGSPGPSFALAAQQQASDTGIYQLAPTQTGPFATLPQPQTTYALGLPPGMPDVRFPADLPNGPFQITRYVPYNAYLGDPPHRFFQMWQQTDGGKHDLVEWVDVTVGIGPSNSAPAPVPGHTGQGGEAMGFFNMSTGDAPVFKNLADQYAISDNYHQSVMGGTGANFLALVTGDAAYFTSGGEAATPFPGQIENPDPTPGTNNFYSNDGYGHGPNDTGGSYVNCADSSQPGVFAIRQYLAGQDYKPFRGGNCDAGHYYLVNNYGLAYTFDGTAKPIGPSQYTLPPQTIPTIADALAKAGVSWKYYSGGRENGAVTGEYCGICDPLTGFSSIMTTSLKGNLQGMGDFDSDAASATTLPAVSFIRPFESKAGHPADATMPDFEGFVADVIARVQANPEVWQHTAIFVTVDEGGGYYDSGYIQAVDFFGDGTRIPLIAVSPWAKKGHVDHAYADHASILKFIERNWGLAPLSERSRDNLPNPEQDDDGDAYVPENRPAIGDLMGLFDFGAAVRHRRD